jgi:hypothetical protein
MFNLSKTIYIGIRSMGKRTLSQKKTNNLIKSMGKITLSVKRKQTIWLEAWVK